MVLANDPGAVVGLLVADDPDTAGALEYRVGPIDDAWFEVVGAMLRLRSGIELLAFAGLTREVLIEVSDGLNVSAFTLPVTVLTPGPPSSFQVTDGTLGPDSLAGSASADALFGHAGEDLLLGALGDDSLEGGTGNDSLDGGAGSDTLQGSEGRDTLLGNDGSDLLRGGGEADLLVGGAGADIVQGEDGNDCTAPGFLDTRLHYAARLRLVSRRAARASSGLR